MSSENRPKFRYRAAISRFGLKPPDLHFSPIYPTKSFFGRYLCEKFRRKRPYVKLESKFFPTRQATPPIPDDFFFYFEILGQKNFEIPPNNKKKNLVRKNTGRIIFYDCQHFAGSTFDISSAFLLRRFSKKKIFDCCILFARNRFRIYI